MLYSSFYSVVTCYFSDFLFMFLPSQFYTTWGPYRRSMLLASELKNLVGAHMKRARRKLLQQRRKRSRERKR